jgi:hypothetical protein
MGRQRRSGERRSGEWYCSERKADSGDRGESHHGEEPQWQGRHGDALLAGRRLRILCCQLNWKVFFYFF